MKFKSLFLSTGALALAVSFTFCTKEEVPTPTPEKQTTVTDRGICNVTVEVFGGAVDVCGTQNNLTLCSTIASVNLFGSDFIPNNGVANYTLATPTQLRFTRNPNLPSAAQMGVLVTTATGSKKYPIPAFGAAVANINDFCQPN